MVRELLSHPHQHFILSAFIDNLLVKFFINLTCISITTSETEYLYLFIAYTQTYTDTHSYKDCNLNPPETTHPGRFYFLYFMEKKKGAEALCGLPQEFWYGSAGGLYLKVFYKPAINVPAGAAVISRLDWGRPLSGWCQDPVLRGLSVFCCMGFTTSQQHGLRLPSEPERE